MAMGLTLACADQEKIVWRLVRVMISSAVIALVVSVVAVISMLLGEVIADGGAIDNGQLTIDNEGMPRGVPCGCAETGRRTNGQIEN
jgi:hypothetical protein